LEQSAPNNFAKEGLNAFFWHLKRGFEPHFDAFLHAKARENRDQRTEIGNRFLRPLKRAGRGDATSAPSLTTWGKFFCPLRGLCARFNHNPRVTQDLSPVLRLGPTVRRPRCGLPQSLSWRIFISDWQCSPPPLASPGERAPGGPWRRRYSPRFARPVYS